MLQPEIQEGVHMPRPSAGCQRVDYGSNYQRWARRLMQQHRINHLLVLMSVQLLVLIIPRVTPAATPEQVQTAAPGIGGKIAYRQAEVRVRPK